MVIQMIRIIYIATLVFLSTSCTSANDGTEPTLYPLNIGKIENIKITSNGIKALAASNSKIHCKNFILSKKEVEKYFELAKKVQKSDYRHMLDWSPCFVAGEITLQNGITGKWSIHQYKAGTINFEDRDTIYTYCPNCKAKMFDKPEYITKPNN